MVKHTLIIALVIAGVMATSATAAWKPGTANLITEEDAVTLLERKFDYAYCDGIPRFGHAGEFPYEEFIVFDCSVKTNGVYCADARLKALKGKRRDTFTLKLLRMCH